MDISLDIQMTIDEIPFKQLPNTVYNDIQLPMLEEIGSIYNYAVNVTYYAFPCIISLPLCVCLCV